MSRMTPQEQAQRELGVLDLVEKGIEEVYGILNARERRHVSLEQIMHCENLEPQFEYRLQVSYKLRQKYPRLHLPHFYWFYTVNGLVDRELVMGALLGGDLMVVEALTREKADELAAKGLKETMTIAKDLKYSALALPDVVEDPMDAMDLVAAGRRANQGAPMGGEMREKIGLMMADRIAQQAPSYHRKRFKRKT